MKRLLLLILGCLLLLTGCHSSSPKITTSAPITVCKTDLPEEKYTLSEEDAAVISKILEKAFGKKVLADVTEMLLSPMANKAFGIISTGISPPPPHACAEQKRRKNHQQHPEKIYGTLVIHLAFYIVELMLCRYGIPFGRKRSHDFIVYYNILQYFRLLIRIL